MGADGFGLGVVPPVYLFDSPETFFMPKIDLAFSIGDEVFGIIDVSVEYFHCFDLISGLNGIHNI